MCGIIGILGKAPVAPLLLDGLKRLEYRGYDSAGIATLVNGHIDRRRAEGKLANLAALLDRAHELGGTLLVAPPRWRRLRDRVGVCTGADTKIQAAAPVVEVVLARMSRLRVVRNLVLFVSLRR